MRAFDLQRWHLGAPCCFMTFSSRSGHYRHKAKRELIWRHLAFIQRMCREVWTASIRSLYFESTYKNATSPGLFYFNIAYIQSIQKATKYLLSRRHHDVTDQEHTVNNTNSIFLFLPFAPTFYFHYESLSQFCTRKKRIYRFIQSTFLQKEKKSAHKCLNDTI